MDKLNKKIVFTLGLMFILNCLIFSVVQAQAEGGTGGIPTTQGSGGTNASDPISARQEKDKDQTEKEEQTFIDQQKQDEEQCKEEVEQGGKIKPTSEGYGQKYSDPYDENNPYKPQGPVPPACNGSNNKTAAYIVANETISETPYPDAGGWSKGIGHFITGNEPPGATTQDLFNADYATAQNCAKQTASKHGVNFDSLSPERQTVIIDMSFNMGCGGGGGVDGFNNMWANIRNAQQTGDQSSWNKAGDEILDSSYSSQVGNRSINNAQIMRTSDGSIIDSKINSYAPAKNFCNGSQDITAWSPFSTLYSLFKTNKAIAENVGDQNIAQSAVDTTSATVGSLLYVPVIEQDGVLIQTTKRIETNTLKIRGLSIQICTHLRAIRRIQSRFEQKMVEDANLMRAKVTEVEKYRQAVFGENGMTKNEYAFLNNEGEEIKGAPLVITNTKSYWENSAKEGEGIALDDIKNSENLNKNEVAEDLVNPNDTSLNSSFTEEDIKNLKDYGNNTSSKTAYDDNGNIVVKNKALDNIPILSSLLRPVRKVLTWLTGNSAWAENEPVANNQGVSDAKYWESWNKLIQPKNNRYGSFIIASEHNTAKKNQAQVVAQQEALQAQGFLPIRTCIEKTSDGKTCRKWITNQPGTIIREADAAAMNAPLDLYIQAQTMGVLSPGNEPDVSDIIKNKPGTGGGGGLGPAVTKPNDISEEAKQIGSDAGTNGRDTDDTGTGSGNDGNVGQLPSNPVLDGFLNQFNQLFSGSGGSGSAQQDQQSFGALQSLFNTVIGLIGQIIESIKPVVIFDYTSPSLADVDAGKDNYAFVGWAPMNVDDCITTNEWFSLEDGQNSLIKERSASIGKKMGNVTLHYPLKVVSTLTKIINGKEQTAENGNLSKNSDRTSEQITYTIENAPAENSFSYNLNLDDDAIKISAKTDASITAEALRETAANKWKGYLFSSVGNQLIITRPAIKLGIKCTNKNGNTVSDIEIRRK